MRDRKIKFNKAQKDYIIIKLRTFSLTTRKQVESIFGLLRGLSNKEMADKENIAENSFKFRLSGYKTRGHLGIYNCLGIRGRNQIWNIFSWDDFINIGKLGKEPELDLDTPIKFKKLLPVGNQKDLTVTGFSGGN